VRLSQLFKSGRARLRCLILRAVQQPETTSAADSYRVAPGITGDWLSPGRFALGLAVLIFAAFPQVLLGLRTFVVRDFGFFVYPLAYIPTRMFWHGQFAVVEPLQQLRRAVSGTVEHHAALSARPDLSAASAGMGR